MEDIQPPEAIYKLTIDPEGDVHLSLRDRGLLVSSKVLSLASPFFKKLFGPHFAEGNCVEAKNPGHVDLHEDDSEAMTSLCYLLHFQMDKVPDNPTSDCLDSIAILADKYDCVRSISQWTSFKLCEAARQAECSISDGRLLFPVYLFDNPQIFKEITKHMVYSVNIDISSLITSSLPKLYCIPDEVAAALPHDLLNKAHWYASKPGLRTACKKVLVISSVFRLERDMEVLSLVGHNLKVALHMTTQSSPSVIAIT